MRKQYLMRLVAPLAICFLTPFTVAAQQDKSVLKMPSIIHKVNNVSERLEMTVNTSRILTLEQKISQSQVNNPELLDITPLSPTQIQISAKATGVTQINLWGADKKVFTINVIVFGDARELQLVLQGAFPDAALKVTPVANAVMISGLVEKAEQVELITKIAEEYYPKIINNMSVGGAQQVLLHVKIMEVSRTKLRQFGFDWGKITGQNVVMSGPGSLLTDYAQSDWITPPGDLIRTTTPSTFAFSVVNGGNAFYGVLDALRQDNLLKIMSEPTLVAINGQPASFISGGEFPVPVPQSLGTLSIEFKNYGADVKFVPIVLGNGKIRLEVSPKLSELDYSTGTTIAGTTVPGIKTRSVNTIVELMAGQTFAIAGIVQRRVEASNAGLPWISEVPYIGAAFRKVKENVNEVELIILVTPEFVEPMDASEVPQCGPGTRTASPSDWELFAKGHLEVPNCCPAPGGPRGGNCMDAAPQADRMEMPPEGMIIEPTERIPAPAPNDFTGRPIGQSRERIAAAAGGRGPYNRHARSKPNSSRQAASAVSENGPPGIIGPVGYDALK